MTERRKFIQKIAGLTAAFSVPSLIQQAWAADWEKVHQKALGLTPQELAADEDYWSVIQQAYTVNPNMVNLNNGGVSPSPRVVQEAVERFNQLSNEAPSYYMWRILDQGREPVRYKLATLAGCSPNEIAINRNATEALNLAEERGVTLVDKVSRKGAEGLNIGFLHPKSTNRVLTEICSDKNAAK